MWAAVAIGMGTAAACSSTDNPASEPPGLGDGGAGGDAGSDEIGEDSGADADADAGADADSGHVDSSPWSRGIEGVIAVDQAAVDATTGDFVVVGTFAGTVDFGSGPLAPPDQHLRAGFIAKFTSKGQLLWAKRFDAVSSAMTFARVAIDVTGHVVVAGSFDAKVDFGGGELTSSGDIDIFLAKLASDGTHVWSKRMGGADRESIGGVAVDSAGNIAVVGSFRERANFGGADITGDFDAFVVTLDPAGNHLSSQRVGDNARAHAVAVDSSGDLVVSGELFGSIDCDGAQLSGSGNGFVAKIGASGGCLWARSFGASSSSRATALTVDSAKNVFVGGHDDGAHVAKLSPAGVPLWEKTTPKAYLESLAMGTLGDVVVTGQFSGDVDFGGGTLSAPSGFQAFFLAYGASGAHLASRTIAPGNSFGQAIATGPDGMQVVAGGYLGGVDFGDGALSGDGMYLAKLKVTP